jgi:hypothetical protein
MQLTITFDLREKERRAITEWWRRHGRWVYEQEAGEADCSAFISHAVGDAIASTGAHSDTGLRHDYTDHGHKGGEWGDGHQHSHPGEEGYITPDEPELDGAGQVIRTAEELDQAVADQ